VKISSEHHDTSLWLLPWPRPNLELPDGVHFAGRASDKELGLSMRVVRQYTINNDSIPTRIDVLYGWAPLYPELACRVAS